MSVSPASPVSPGSPTTVQGSLQVVDGVGVVRLEARLDTDAGDVWSALTEPDQLARWLGEVTGDLRVGGELHARWLSSGWEGSYRVVECQPPQRLRLVRSPEGTAGGLEATLTVEGGQTVLVAEFRGAPLDNVAAYGAGNQIHVEDLAAYLAGGERCDAHVRWEELHPGYQVLAARL